MSFLVRRYLDAQCLVGFTHFHFLAVDGGLLAIDGGGGAGIVHDGEHGILRNLLELLAGVEVDVALKDVNAEIVVFALLEQRVSVDIFIAVLGIAYHLHGVNGIVEVGHGNALLAEGTVLLSFLHDCNRRVGTILAQHLGAVAVVAHLVAHL